jgi:hypothetical protein
MNIFFIFVFLSAWVSILIYIGIPQTYKMLGGSTGIYFLLPLIVCIILKYKELWKLIWSLILVLVGLIATNYLYSYFFFNPKIFNFITTIYIIYFPITLIVMGYVFTIQNLIAFEKKADFKKKDNGALSNFGMLVGLIFSMPPLIGIPILNVLKGSENIFLRGYQIEFGILITSFIVFLLDSRKISTETLYYFGKKIRKFNGNIVTFRKSLIIGIFILLVFSTHWEFFYRGQWILWAESIIILITYSIMLYRFGRILFTPDGYQFQKPSDYYLPSIKSKRGYLIGLIFLFLFFLMLIIGALQSVISRD